VSNAPKDYDYSKDEAECLRLLHNAAAKLEDAVALVSRPPHVSPERSPLFAPFESVAALAKQGLDKLKYGPTDFGAVGTREQ
jgi:hypothetical protein